MKYVLLIIVFFLFIIGGVINTYALPLPKPLDKDDFDRYKKIFELQQKGYFNKADLLIKQLNNKILIGNILSQRYLHPTGYISKFTELKSWLDKYGDHPSASRIYWLSKKKKPNSSKNAKKPQGGFLSGFGGTSLKTLRPPIPISFVGRSAPTITRKIANTVRKNIRRGWPSGSKEVLNSKNSLKYLTKTEKAQLHWEIGNAYFIFNKDLEAINESAKAIILSDGLHSNSWFTAGISSWRRGDFLRAKIFFENLAILKSADGHTRASGAYWASRVAIRDGDYNKALSMLKIAAYEENSFYGQLALASLGIDNNLNFDLPEISNEFLFFLKNHPSGKRVFAFLQLDLHWYADRELRRLFSEVPENLQLDLMSFCAINNLPSLAYRIADIQRKKTNINWYGALYPDLENSDDFFNDKDKALIHSIIRQESKFDQRGKSYARALGLMQIIPSTASFVTGNKGYLGKLKHDLLLKNTNIKIGNNYISQLLKEKIINYNIVYLLAAYNGGPGNLNKWK
ncbi:MAG: lytic murein transglycosylase, partial [Rickettsiales bacterium]|nr:lytic murein transglycosylase [Rickettsiales bacterium]